MRRGWLRLMRPLLRWCELLRWWSKLLLRSELLRWWSTETLVLLRWYEACWRHLRRCSMLLRRNELLWWLRRGVLMRETRWRETCGWHVSLRERRD
ncbi:unnamed protein product [Haemonchus placei]|uniref:Uncharacterized protein n=1 Tax=Haemonchus placei TaxID=6290 RepID=A0A3P7TQU6_HAEPC|nr:unnamed protein product [Haemonchus placei]